MNEAPDTLAGYARAVVSAAEPAEKVRLAEAAGAAWRAGRLSLHRGTGEAPMPDRPGRPARPVLLPPRDMPKRSLNSAHGRIALLHALTHIELNALDLAFDLLGRFIAEPMPRAFFDAFVTVGCEEAYHFKLLEARLRAAGAAYGDLPAHDGLWEAATETGHSLVARLAIIPLVLEARGLDVTPGIIDKMVETGEAQAAAALEIVYRDEKGHVATGMTWFRFLCERDGHDPVRLFQDLVRRHFRGGIKPPFNDRARSEAGLTPGFYKPIAGIAR